MALNSNHTFEELENIKCSIVEKKCNAERSNFLKTLLEHNGFKVIIVNGSTSEKAALKPTDENKLTLSDIKTNSPEAFTIGVTDLSFNPTKSIYNRELKTLDGWIVTHNYWKQKESIYNNEKWYWEK